jgi:DNA repair photolyase
VYCYSSGYIPRFFECRPKEDLISKLRKEASKLHGEVISIANSSDPYPSSEADMKLTRKCLEILCLYDCAIQIITKSNLVVRDADLLKKIPSMVSLTITTEDDDVARLIEPDAPSSTERLKAVKALVEKGVPTSVRIDPVIPFVNDDSEGLVQKVARLGVMHVTSSTLKIKADGWRRLSSRLPKTADKLKQLYFGEGERVGGYIYLSKRLRVKLMKNVGGLAKEYSMKFGTCREGLSHLNTEVCDGSWLLGSCH